MRWGADYGLGGRGGEMRPPSPWWIVAAVLSGLHAEARTPPHIVIIVIDDLGWHKCFKKLHPKVRNHGEGPY